MALYVCLLPWVFYLNLYFVIQFMGLLCLRHISCNDGAIFIFCGTLECFMSFIVYFLHVYNDHFHNYVYKTAWILLFQNLISLCVKLHHWYSRKEICKGWCGRHVICVIRTVLLTDSPPSAADWFSNLWSLIISFHFCLVTFCCSSLSWIRD